MDKAMMIRYGGRTAGAAVAYYVVGRKMTTAGMLAAVAIGWLAGGLIVDRYGGMIA